MYIHHYTPYILALCRALESTSGYQLKSVWALRCTAAKSILVAEQVRTRWGTPWLLDPGHRDERIGVIKDRFTQISSKSRHVSRRPSLWGQKPLEPVGSGGNEIGLLYIFVGDPSEYHDREFRTKLRIRIKEEVLKSKKLQPRSPRHNPVVAVRCFQGNVSGMAKEKGVEHSPRKKKRKRDLPIPWKKMRKMNLQTSQSKKIWI